MGIGYKSPGNRVLSSTLKYLEVQVGARRRRGGWGYPGGGLLFYLIRQPI